jgi:hypothetical protein
MWGKKEELVDYFTSVQVTPEPTVKRFVAGGEKSGLLLRCSVY